MKGQKERRISKRINVVLLESHVMSGFDSEKEAIKHFANKHNILTQRVKRWIAAGAVWADGQVYLRKSKFSDSPVVAGDECEAVLLSDYIRVNFDNNATNFAEKHGTTQQQACRWLKANTIYLAGEVFRQQTCFGAAHA